MKNRVYFFNKIIDCIINLILIIVLTAIALLCWYHSDFLKEKAEYIFNYSFSNLAMGILLIIIEIIILGVFSFVKKLLKRRIGVNSFVKHKLYSKLRPMILKCKHTFSRVLGNKSLNAFYYTNYKPTPEQKLVSIQITSILRNEKSDNDNNVFWIQGSSFSGKTTTISQILINIISRNDSYKTFNIFNNRIVYIDLFKDNYNKFIDKYEKQKYSKSILIIDNTCALSDKLLQQLIDKIYKAVLAKIIIVCLRDFNEISNDLYFINKLKEKMDCVGQHFYIPQVCSAISSKQILDPRCRLKNFGQMELGCQFHYANMCEKNKENGNKTFEDILSYLDGKISIDNIKHKIIFVISSFCIFTGSFTTKQLYKYFTGIKSKFVLDIILSELHSCGFIDRSPYGFGEIYIFNSDVAKCYFKIGYKSKYLKDLSHNILEQQYDYYYMSENHLAFLYGCLLKNESKKLSKMFDSIAINTNFRLFLNEMEFLESVEKSIGLIYKREIGILCDRTGEFIRSRKAFRDLINICEKNGNIDLAVETFYRLVQIDHTEYDKHNKLKNYTSSSSYLQLQKKYWKLHINMHKGIFSFDGFIDLLDDAKVLTKKKCYDNLHLARRIYFDVYRLYYLEGSNDTKKLIKIKKTGFEIENYLKENLTEYNLYYTKFTSQFLLCFDLVYNLVLYEDTVDKDVYKEFIESIGIAPSIMYEKNKLLEKAIKLCEELEKGFENIGDKTFNFIRYYRTSLLIIHNDPTVKSLIKQYRDFGAYEIEYQLYAEFIELKYRISELLKFEKITNYNESEYNILRKNVASQFKTINKFFLDGYSNDYAVMRCNVYKLLLNIIDQKQVPEKLFKSALDLAQKNNYQREIRLLENIKYRKIENTLSFGWIRNALLYYPIVPQ